MALPLTGAEAKVNVHGAVALGQLADHVNVDQLLHLGKMGNERRK
jgi:hypothetical protein